MDKLDFIFVSDLDITGDVVFRGDLDLTNAHIINVGDPVDSFDYADTAWVEQQINLAIAEATSIMQGE